MSDIAKMIAIAKKFGGGSSAPAPVVILPETEMTGEGSQYTLPNPPENAPIGGGNYRIVWDGVEYFSPALDVTGTIGEGTPMFAFGNSAVAFGEDGAAQIGNPAPGAPYFLALIPNGKEVTEGGPIAYGMLAATEEPTAPVLSIVQTEGGSADGGSDSGVFTVRATQTTENKITDIDKSFAEGVAAFQAGKYVHLLVSAYNGETVFNYPVLGLNENGIVFRLQVGADIFWTITWNADGMALDLTGN